MKRQPYFPRTIDRRPEWFAAFATQLALANATLGLPADDVTDIVADARFCEYACGVWLTAVREFGPAATASVEELLSGSVGASFTLSVFTAPALPSGVSLVAAGALDRIFLFVQTIKACPNYTEAIGLQLGIVGAEDAAENPVPTFTLKVERGAGCECVRLAFKNTVTPVWWSTAVATGARGRCWRSTLLRRISTSVRCWCRLRRRCANTGFSFSMARGRRASFHPRNR